MCRLLTDGLVACKIIAEMLIQLRVTTRPGVITLKTNYSQSISFLSWCLTQWPVGDSGQPVSVRCQDQQTDDSRVKARHSELLDLPGCRRQKARLSPVSKSLRQIIKNALISTVSNISTGRSLSFYSNNITCTFTVHKKMYDIFLCYRTWVSNSKIVIQAQSTSLVLVLFNRPRVISYQSFIVIMSLSCTVSKTLISYLSNLTRSRDPEYIPSEVMYDACASMSQHQSSNQIWSA